MGGALEGRRGATGRDGVRKRLLCLAHFFALLPLFVVITSHCPHRALFNECGGNSCFCLTGKKKKKKEK